MKIALKADNGLYVAAEGGGDNNGILVANRSSVGPWEEFTVHKFDDGTIALESHNGRFWCAEGEGGGALHCNRARVDDMSAPEHLRTAIGGWEHFRVIGDINKNGSTLAFQTPNGRFHVASEIGSDTVLVANREWIQGWETFTVEVLEADAGVILPARKGVIKRQGKAVADDDGQFLPLGITLFWALFGWKFENDRIKQHLAWIASKGIDYVRILCEVDWNGRSIDPDWSDYEQVLGEFLDYAYDVCGLRSELTVIGGSPRDKMDLSRKVINVVSQGRVHKVAHFEMCNEWERLDKATMPEMQAMAKLFRAAFPDSLIALSQPGASDEEHNVGGWQIMNDASKACGANMLTEHTERKEADRLWRQVRQGYDFQNTPFPGSHNEPPGPQASAGGHNDSPVHIALMRAVGVHCGAPFYVFHVAQGVTGRAEPKYNRPENMWDVPNIDACIDALHAVGKLLPTDCSNWKVINNGRSNHPLQLDGSIGKGFWEGDSAGSVNKNYAAAPNNGAGPEFIITLLGVQAKTDGQRVLIGKASRKSVIEAYNPVTGELVETVTLNAGQEWSLPGRVDTKIGYVLKGRYV